MIHWEELQSKAVTRDGKPAGYYEVPRCWRAKVPGGWLVTAQRDGIGVAFYPDPKHTWDGNSLMETPEKAKGVK